MKNKTIVATIVCAMFLLGAEVVIAQNQKKVINNEFAVGGVALVRVRTFLKTPLSTSFDITNIGHSFEKIGIEIHGNTIFYITEVCPIKFPTDDGGGSPCLNPKEIQTLLLIPPEGMTSMWRVNFTPTWAAKEAARSQKGQLPHAIFKVSFWMLGPDGAKLYEIPITVGRDVMEGMTISVPRPPNS
jgi:hypothetical protein